MHGLVLCVRRPSGHVSILFLINTISVPLFLHQRHFHLLAFFINSFLLTGTHANIQISLQGCNSFRHNYDLKLA